MVRLDRIALLDWLVLLIGSIGRSVCWLIGWLVDWLVGWWVDWLVGGVGWFG